MSVTTLEELEYLKSAIENLKPIHQVEILRIFHNAGVKLNPSKFGIYVNLTPLSSELLDAIHKKVDFITDRERTLYDFEKKTEEYKSSIRFEKQDKEKMLEFPIRTSEDEGALC